MLSGRRAAPGVVVLRAATTGLQRPRAKVRAFGEAEFFREIEFANQPIDCALAMLDVDLGQNQAHRVAVVSRRRTTAGPGSVRVPLSRSCAFAERVSGGVSVLTGRSNPARIGGAAPQRKGPPL